MAEGRSSDLIGAGLTAALAVWFLAVLGAFFFVGVGVGVIVLLGGLILFGVLAVRAIARADTSE
jgi:hypothetical protein